MLLALLLARPAFANSLYWPWTGASSYKVYEVTQWDPITLVFVKEVFENRFNLDGQISTTKWTFFAVSNCCGQDCSAIPLIVGIRDTDQTGNPEIKLALILYEIELETPIVP